MSGWMTAIVAPHVLRGVRAAGGDPAPLATRFGLAERYAYEDRLPVATVVDLWEAAIALTGRRDLPLLARTTDEHQEHSLLSFVVANQPRLGDGVDCFDRYFPTVSDAYRWRAADRDDDLVFRCEPVGPVHRLGWQAYLEFESTDLIEIGRRLTEGPARPTALRYVHPSPPPAVAAALADAAGVSPEFGAEVTEIVYPRAMRELVVPSARPGLSNLVEDWLAAMLRAIELGAAVSARARDRVPALLRAGQTSVDDLARALHMSRRSLERALSGEGLTASALFEDERRRLAEAWLPHLSVDEVADRLGYSDARAFARAFKRWTGVPPGAYRGVGVTAGSR